MKRCPECRRDYYDDSLLYCLDDGTALLEGPASGNEPATAILHETGPPGDAATRAQLQTTDRTAGLSSSKSDPLKRKNFDKRLLLAPVALAVIVLGGFFGYRYINSADEIALAVVDALKVKLLGQQRAAVLKRQTSDPAALDAYLQGLSYFTKFTPEFFSRSIDRFEAAIAIDPNYAAAYAGLAECFSELSFFSSTGDWTGKAKAAAARSVKLDDSLGRAHNALAITLMYFDLDFAAAEREFRRAIALEPGSAHIQMWFAWFLGLTRRFDEALEQMNQARALDPLSPLIAFGIGAISLWAGKNEDAIEHLIRLTEMNPEFPLAHSYLAEAYIEKGDVAAAVSAIEAAPTSLDDPISLSAVAYVYACAGERDRARKIIDDLIASDRADPVDVQIAQVYAAFGEFERAFEWLEKAFQRHSVWLMWTGVEPAFKALRSDERFHRFLNRMGLSQRTV